MDPWQLNVRHLRLFVRTAEKGVLRAAAECEHLSQPAATQAIAKLEAELGVLLFHRQNEGMRLTDEGAVLSPRFAAAVGHIGSKRLTNAQVRAFLAVARTGSYSQASHETGLTTASLHRAVADMASALATSVLKKTGRRIELTGSGRSWARRLGLAQAEIQAGLDELALVSGKGRARIVVGAMPLSRAKLIPSAIAGFDNSMDSAQICVVDGSHSELLEPLRDGRIDFMIGAIRERSLGSDIVQEPLFVDRPVIVARSGHPVLTSTRKRPPSIGSLHRYQWCISRRGTPLREKWEAAFAEAGAPTPDVHVECGSVLVARQILLDTDCLAVLSPDQLAAEIDAGWITVLGPVPSALHRTIALTFRKDWRPTSVQVRFLERLRQLASEV